MHLLLPPNKLSSIYKSALHFLVIKHPKDGMNINIPQMIKKYGSKYLKNPNAPLNLKIDKVTKGDGKGEAIPKRIDTHDGFKLGIYFFSKTN